MGTCRDHTAAVVSVLRGRIGPIVRFAVLFELLRLLILTPLAAGLLQLALARWGRCSVGNFEIIDFLTSLPGLAGLLAVGTVALTTFYLELAGLIVLLADRRATAREILPELAARLLQLLRLSLRQIVILIVLAAPFLGAIGLIPRTIWAGHDLNGLIVLKPPVFWVGVAVAAGLGTVFAVIAGLLVLRWLLALPSVLFAPEAPDAEALGFSPSSVRGHVVSILRSIVTWLLLVTLLATVVMGALHFGSDWLLDRAGLSLSILLPVTAAVLIANFVVAAFLSVVGSASFAALVLVLHREITGVSWPDHAPVPSTARTLPPVPGRWAIVGMLGVFVLTVGVVSYGLLARVRLHERLEITAHRAGAAGAPENTVAAILQAIEDRADWAEIDVQRTADGAIVVTHDSDLARVAGLRQRVADTTLAQIQAIDVGSRFGEPFIGERIPTFDELIAAAGDRIRLNIELKPNGPQDVEPLVRAVVASVQQAGISARCRICSQSYAGIQLARQLEPEVQIGFIAGEQLGDLSRLDVNYLMVTARLATRRLTERAGVQKMEVHAWTINDPQALAPLLDRGVANIITDDPAAMRQRLEEIRQLTPAERLLLRARNLLAD